MRRRNTAEAAVVFAALSLLMVGWALATPLTSAPDEPTHVLRASVVAYHGLSPESTVELPSTLVELTALEGCTKHRQDRTGACTSALVAAAERAGGTSPVTVSSFRPVYYSLVGWPLRWFPDSTGVYLSRGVSALVCATLVSLAFFVTTSLGARRARFILLGATTPTLLFLGGSVNPNSVEACAALLTWAALSVMARADDPELVPSHTVHLMGVGAALLLLTRALGPAWLFLIVVAAVIVGGRARTWMWLGTRAVRLWVLALAVMFLVDTRSSGDPHSVTALAPGGATNEWISGSLWLRHEVPFFVDRTMEIIGSFGWNDTASPMFVYATWLLLFGAACLIVFTSRRPKGVAVSFGLTVLTLVAVPAASDWRVHGGEIFVWEGRYGLAAAVGLPVLAALCQWSPPNLDADRKDMVLRIVAGAVVAAHGAAFYWTLARYVDGRPGDLGVLHGEWQPPGGAALAVLVFGAGLAVLVAVAADLPRRSASDRARDPGDPVERAPEPASARTPTPR